MLLFLLQGMPKSCLEYEKAWLNLILIEKKNYAYAKYEIGKPVPKIDIKGIEVIKRGPPPFVRRAGVKMLNKICMESDVDGSIRHVIDEKKRLRSGELPFTDFIYMKKSTILLLIFACFLKLHAQEKTVPVFVPLSAMSTAMYSIGASQIWKNACLKTKTGRSPCLLPLVVQ